MGASPDCDLNVGYTPSMPDEPIRTTTYTLTRVDALAYEQAAWRMTPLGVLALLCWLGLCGVLAILIPPEWAGPRPGLTSSMLIAIFIAVAYVWALLLIAFRQWRAARRRVRRPHEVTISEWADRLDILSIGMPRTLFFVNARRSILTRTHLFLEADEEVLILPRRAFREVGTIEALAKRLEVAPRPALVSPTPVEEPPKV
jgi:hypothetical protein